MGTQTRFLSQRKLLRQAIEREITPLLLKRGYKVRRAHGDIEFRKETHDQLHILNIQFDKWNRPLFRVNLARFPSSGIIDEFGNLKAGDGLEYFSSDQRAQLYPHSLWIVMPPWFSARPYFTKQDVKKVHGAAARLIELLPVAEEWLRTGKVTKYINVFRLRRADPGTLSQVAPSDRS